MSRRLLTMLILLAATPLTLWFALSQGSLNISAQELWLGGGGGGGERGGGGGGGEGGVDVIW